MAVRYEKSENGKIYVLSWDEQSSLCQFQTPDGQVVDLDPAGARFLIQTLPLIRFARTSARRHMREERTGLRNAGAPWTPELDVHLRRLWDQNPVISEIAHELERTEGAIRSRLVKLGLVEGDINFNQGKAVTSP